MAQVRLLKIDPTYGIPYEMDTASDDITLNSYTVQGGGPVLSGTGLDMNNQDVSDVNDLAFNNPATGTINQTAGALIIDNLMAKERSNLLTTAADILFPTISDTAGQVDMLRLPSLAGSPTATPTTSGEGFLVWNSTADSLFAWTGSVWKDLSIVEDAERVTNVYTAEVSVAARDVVYISSADNVSPASASSATTSSGTIGLAKAAAAPAASVDVVSEGVMTGFSGLTAGARYYLSTTAGAISTSIPTGSGNVVVLCGIAKSATELHVRIEDLGRRA